MEDLFAAVQAKSAPLADRMRPRSFAEFVGQTHIVGEGRLLRRAIEADRLQSSIFYGPPGTGKTTLAAIVAASTKAAFEKLNAVSSGVSDVREVIARAESRLKLYSQATYLLLDECHRWNKAQQDAILPAIESGVIRFIGSTTENPRIAMTPAIVSRCRVFEFLQLTSQDVVHAMRRALTDEERGLGRIGVVVQEEALAHIARMSGGDARTALNALELAALTTQPASDGAVHVTLAVAEESIQRPYIPMDESLYYDMLSAFCKSLRGSDSDAALFWAFRMIEAGVDPRIIVRRLTVHASEDVGLANPNAMLIAEAAARAMDSIGMPEAGIPLTQAIIYVCESPKSNSVVAAMGAAMEAARTARHEGVPAYLRDMNYADQELKKQGARYKYPHNFPGHYVEQAYLPVSLQGKVFYEPSDQGAEQKTREAWLRRKNMKP